MSGERGSDSSRPSPRSAGGRRRRTVGAAVFAFALVFVVATAVGGTQATHDEQVPSGTATSAFKQTRLDSRLARVSADAAAAGDAAAANRSKTVGVTAEGDRVRVVVESSDVAAATTAVRA